MLAFLEFYKHLLPSKPGISKRAVMFIFLIAMHKYKKKAKRGMG